MDWNSNLRTFLPRPEASFDFLYNYSYDQYPGTEMKHTLMAEKAHGLIPGMDKSIYGSQEKKKRLTSDQLDSLERSFQEEIKLDPDRKMKLSRELGLQPRQIAVWFQNRRARWKAKQLEMLYDTLKQEFDAVSKEKQKLQEEVMKLKSMLRGPATGKQVSSAGYYTEISGEETVESASLAMQISPNKPARPVNDHHQNIAEGNYIFNVVEEYNNPPGSSPFWGVLPSYP